MADTEIMTIKEVSKYLKMNERTVYKLIQDGQIPAAKLGKQWRLNKEKLNEWLGFKMAEMPSEDLIHIERDHKEAVIKISPLLKEENVIFNFYAVSKTQTIQKLVEVITKNNKLTLQEGEKLKQAVIERERLCSTAVGEGVAIPHPRNVIITDVKKTLLAVGICKHGMDYESMDGSPTNLIFLLSAPRNDIHLKLMARLSRLLRDKVFRYKLVNVLNFKEFKQLVKTKEDAIDAEVK